MNFKKMVVAAALAASMIGTGVAKAYTEADVTAASASKDVATLKKIVDDNASGVDVRGLALHRLPVTAELLPYLKADWMNARWRAMMTYDFAQKGILPVADYPAAIVDWLATKNHRVARIQTFYVTALLKAGNTEKALSESKRLMGISPQQQDYLLITVNTIAGAIKASALKDGKSATEAIAAFNAYLEAINNENVSGLPYTALPFPPLDPEVVALESNADPQIAALALLYNGKYDAAAAKGNDLLIAATSPADVEYALFIIGGAANGKAGLPTAANAATGEGE